MLFGFVREVCLHHLKSSYAPVGAHAGVALPQEDGRMNVS
jgi:hypothetical protein